MSKIRVNFLIPQHIYNSVQDIAKNEDTSSADIFRKAIKEFVFNYHNTDINKYFSNQNLIPQEDIANDRTE